MNTLEETPEPIVTDLMTASIKEQLWHSMRLDLGRFIPELQNNQLLLCYCCGRFLGQEFFDLEHLIPRQALRNDPSAVRSNPATPNNVRSGNLLLCKKPLLYRGSKLYDNGCNSWKGRFYDKPMPSGLLLREQFFRPNKFHPRLDARHQMILTGEPFTGADTEIWRNPFAFAFERGACIVTIRHFAIVVPVSRDPFAPIAQHLRIVPEKYKLRPNFQTSFT
ncbi:hypothetical protein [Bradyrhizobium sp. S69]|uniref:hypothetical protein n=1 Tax=Bradyrhizobium sp. S69 TaxID=1641856 RepID=UPI00131CBA68|nr:hypothetical protein [Bradyrhizobium sp. S69]